ncbi:MAG: DNA double-strand break repair nuclease NurA, partial [Chloroflexota bacterium]|nr:DNA double-strand break repair nuclease NurA [Chloroflexota bacterium]
MPLDLGKTILQLDRVSRGLVADSGHKETRLTAFIEAASKVDAATAIAKTGYDPDRPFLAAQVLDSLLGSYAPVEPPMDWCIVAVDGSHIDVDRHLPVGCYLINMGGCSLTYGSQPDASFFSQPSLYHRPEDLYLTDPSNSAHEEPVAGPLLGLLRTVQELERLAQAIAEVPAGLPTLALVDGSLVMWGLSGQGYPPFIKEAIIQDRLLPAMDRL